MEISKSKIKTYAALSARKHRENQGLFVAEGMKCVLETLPFFTLEALILTPVCMQAHGLPRGVPAERVFTAVPRQMEQISSLSTPPAMLAVYRLPEPQTPEPADLKDELALALDGVQDPGNLGTIMRTADWFGVRHILASRQTADIFNPKAVQATMGAIGRVRVSYVDLPVFLTEYRAATGLPVYGTLLDGDSIYTSELSAKGLIAMGNEGKGLTAEVRSLVSRPLLIPSWPAGAPAVESLNVAMATAITLAEFRRRLS